MRVALALLLSISLAVVAFVMTGSSLATFLVVSAGICATVLGALPAPAPVATRIATDEQPTGEADIIEAVSEPLVLVVDGRVRIANRAAKALLGAHIVGEDVRLAIRHPAATDRLAAGASDGSTELSGLGRRDQFYDMHVATVRTGTRIIHLSDRTGRHAVERARVDFVANASHELRTPLAAILGFIETLSDENAGNDAAIRSRFLSVMDNEARRMQRLIDDLISLSRIEADKHALPDTRVAIPVLVARVAAEINGRGTAAPLELAIEEPVPDVQGEDAQLSQVLHNLIGNAIKYGREGEPVKIAVQHEGDDVRISVTDRGEGIAAQHLPRLTERFYRVDAGRSRGLGGTGLGLAIVKHIVERHRGRLDIASKVGVGTTVSVLLPAAPANIVTQSSPN